MRGNCCCEPVSIEDCELLDMQVGLPGCQQDVESLASLVALRVWVSTWRHLRSSVALALASPCLPMLAHFKGGTPALNLLASEIALDAASAVDR